MKNATTKTTNTILKVGAHLSVAGGYANALDRTTEIGVPGFDKKGPDKKNVDVLKNFAG